MIFAWENQIDAAVLVASSEIATLPAANVQQAHLSRKWHTVSGVKTASLIIDCNTSLSFSLGVLLGTNLTSNATVRWRASNTDSTVLTSLVLDTGVTSAGIKIGYGASYKSWPMVSARWRRVDITDNAVPDNLQIGRVFTGPSWQPSINMEIGWKVMYLDVSTVAESYGGQSWADERPKKRVLQFSLGFMNESEMFTNAFSMAQTSGVVRDVLAIPDITSSLISEQSVYGLIEFSEPIIEEKLGLFRQAFRIKERL